MTQPTAGVQRADRRSARGRGGVARLSAAAVAGTGLPVQVVSCGVPFLFVPLATRSAVDNAVDATRAIARSLFCDQTRVAGARRVRVLDGAGRRDKATVYSRMFAPELGVVEDPATGSASGPLGCYLVRHKVVPAEKAGAMLSLQGVKMGRPSHVHISIGVEHGEISSVRVGGEAVLAGEGTLYITRTRNRDSN